MRLRSQLPGLPPMPPQTPSPPSAPRASWPRRLRAVGLGAALMGSVLLVPYVALAALFWAADGAWEFAGPGLRHWIFVRGSRLDRLGLVEPVADADVRYSISLQEGTFPGWSIAMYQSTAAPEEVSRAYAGRCAAARYKVIAHAPPTGPDKPAELTCEIEPDIHVEMTAARAPGASATRVWIKVWGDR